MDHEEYLPRPRPQNRPALQRLRRPGDPGSRVRGSPIGSSTGTPNPPCPTDSRPWPGGFVTEAWNVVLLRTPGIMARPTWPPAMGIAAAHHGPGAARWTDWSPGSPTPTAPAGFPTTRLRRCRLIIVGGRLPRGRARPANLFFHSSDGPLRTASTGPSSTCPSSGAVFGDQPSPPAMIDASSTTPTSSPSKGASYRLTAGNDTLPSMEPRVTTARPVASFSSVASAIERRHQRHQPLSKACLQHRSERRPIALKMHALQSQRKWNTSARVRSSMPPGTWAA